MTPTDILNDLATFEATLPEAPVPVGSYVTAVQTGNLLLTSGILPMEGGQVKYTGHVDSIMNSVPEGQAAAKLACINALSVIKSHLGSLSRIERVVKLTGFVNASSQFTQQPAVINGASDFLVELLGDKGRHARSAVGVSSLPLDAMVEIELIIEVKA